MIGSIDNEVQTVCDAYIEVMVDRTKLSEDAKEVAAIAVFEATKLMMLYKIAATLGRIARVHEDRLKTERGGV